jgi:hypothetical protein
MQCVLAVVCSWLVLLAPGLATPACDCGIEADCRCPTADGAIGPKCCEDADRSCDVTEIRQCACSAPQVQAVQPTVELEDVLATHGPELLDAAARTGGVPDQLPAARNELRPLSYRPLLL